MPTLKFRYGLTRPVINGFISHQGTPLTTVFILLDTGADVSYISHSFCKKYQLQPEADIGVTTKTTSDNGCKTHTYTGLTVTLIDQDQNGFPLSIEKIASVEGSNDDAEITIGMDVLSKCQFNHNGVTREFTLDFFG